MGMAIVFLILFLTQPIFSSGISLYWQDKPLDISLGPRIEKGIIYIPAKALDTFAEVELSTNQVFLNYQEQEYIFSLNSLEVKGTIKKLSQPPKVFDGEYYLPLEALTDILTIAVKWDGEGRRLFFNTLKEKPEVLGIDFYEEGNKAILSINCQGSIKYTLEKTEPGKWKLDLKETSLTKPLPWMLIEHPLLYAVRVEQLSKDTVTFYFQVKEGLELNCTEEKSRLKIEFMYAVESFEYHNSGGLPLILPITKTDLPEYKEYINAKSQLIRVFQGVKLTGPKQKKSIDDAAIEYIEFYEKGDSVICLLQLKPALAKMLANNISTNPLAELVSLKSITNELGTVVELVIQGDALFRISKGVDTLNIDFTEIEANNLIRDIKKTVELKAASLLRVQKDTARLELALGDYRGYAVLKKDAATYQIQLIRKDLREKLIVIDPGHGGHDPGALGKILKEKDLTLNIAKKLCGLLKDLGYQVLLTRKADLYVSLADRVRVATSSEADLFISIHLNGSTNLLAAGIETFYGPFNQEAYKVAEAVHKKLLETTKAQDRSVKEGNYWVLLNNIKRAILVEAGFITNTLEETKFNSDQYQYLVAVGIAEGLNSYLQSLK